jgi:hypothetical protein
MTNGPSDDAVIAIRNDYMWIGSPKLGEFSIYVDGGYAGRAAVGATETIPVSVGTHTVRVRLWWYLSPRITVEVNSGSAVDFKADIRRNRNLLNRMVKGMFDPFHSLLLEEMADVPGPEPVP